MKHKLGIKQINEIMKKIIDHLKKIGIKTDFKNMELHEIKNYGNESYDLELLFKLKNCNIKFVIYYFDDTKKYFVTKHTGEIVKLENFTRIDFLEVLFFSC